MRTRWLRHLHLRLLVLCLNLLLSVLLGLALPLIYSLSFGAGGLQSSLESGKFSGTHI